ncbi:hypothetical protein HD806DRAFT_475868 [Xylariaceae sp. AK1471]|nr:hypothetical protein HD806DRAFT_475868 [Xylariaceae sp. AK1471]
MPPSCSIKPPKVIDSQTAGFNVIALAKCIIEDGSKIFLNDEATAFGGTSLQDLTVVREDNDNVRLSVSARDSTPYSISDPDSQYPARFRIPPSTLRDLPEEECKKRAPRFAVGCLIYNIITGEPPFADLDESIAQQTFEQGIYPEKTREFPLEILIKVLGFWSQEFHEIVEQNDREGSPTAASKVLTHIKAHPISSGISAVGLGALGVVSLVNPALGIAGFSAMGPAAGSAAAAWQSSVGLVQAGSFFAWCQSAAMGGAAAGTIAGLQGVGLGVAGLGGLGTLRSILNGSKDEGEKKRMIWSLFTENVRKIERENTDEQVEGRAD